MLFLINYNYIGLNEILTGIVFLVFLWMTLFRRELSSNNNYRDFKSRNTYDLSSISLKRSCKVDRYYWPFTVYYNDYSIWIICGMVSSLYANSSLKVLSTGDKKSPRNQPIHADNLFSIARFLNYTETSSLLMTCCSYNILASDDFLWKQIWNSRYGHLWINPRIKDIRLKRGGSLMCELDKLDPIMGWKTFLIEFDFCWKSWLIAGCCNESLCLLGIGENLYDITSFLGNHPGSVETLLNYAGADVTNLFSDIGHSSYAHSLLESHILLENRISTMPTLRSKTMEAEALIVKDFFDNNRAAHLPSEFEMCTGRSICHPTTPLHFGQSQVCFDPVRREWIGWYSCCGLGRVFDINHAKKRL